MAPPSAAEEEDDGHEQRADLQRARAVGRGRPVRQCHSRSEGHAGPVREYNHSASGRRWNTAAPSSTLEAGERGGRRRQACCRQDDEEHAGGGLCSVRCSGTTAAWIASAAEKPGTARSGA